MSLTDPEHVKSVSALFNSMHLFLLPSEYNGEPHITVDNEKFHYLTNVLRLKQGNSFDGQDLKGTLYNLKIISVSRQSLVLECKEKKVHRRKALPEITLYQCICKGKKMDRIIRQATEIGVTAIIPVISEYTIPRMDRKDIKNKIERWQRIVREAVQQSASSVVTKITTPKMLTDLEKSKDRNKINLFFHQIPLETQTLHEYLSGYPSRISLVIGPEGGLSEKETELLIEKGFRPVFLQTNILRAETAAVYGLSTVQTILMEREFWKEI